MIEPSLQVVDLLTKNIRELDRAIERLCDEKYPHTRRLRQVMGVGAITSLSFVLTIEDPERFRQPRDVAACLGLARISHASRLRTVRILV